MTIDFSSHTEGLLLLACRLSAQQFRKVSQLRQTANQQSVSSADQSITLKLADEFRTMSVLYRGSFVVILWSKIRLQMVWCSF